MSDKKISVSEIKKALEENAEVRKEIIQLLASKYSEEYLGKVFINTDKLKDVSASFVSSDKEWQE